MDNLNLIEEIDKLETSLVAELNDLRATTEIVLKELTIYLSVSANDITKIREHSDVVKSSLENINKYIDKLDFIKSKIIELPQEFSKLNQSIKNANISSQNYMQKVYNASANNLKLAITKIDERLNFVVAELSENKKNILAIDTKLDSIAITLNSYKEDLNKSQERLLGVINTLIQNRGELDKADIYLKESKYSTDAEKHKNKIMLAIKIIGALTASTGAVVLIIEIIRKASQAGG